MKNIFFYQDKNFSHLFTNFLKTRQQTNTEIMGVVKRVIENVKVNKNQAVIEYTKKFDNIDLSAEGLRMSHLIVATDRGLGGAFLFVLGQRLPFTLTQ